MLEAVLPELTALHGVEQSDYHHLDVYDHTLEVLARQIELEQRLAEVFGAGRRARRAVLAEPLGDELTRAQALRFGALLHDIGKPATRDVLARTAASPSWATTPSASRWSRDLCRRLRTSERFARFVGGLTRHHLVLGFLVHERPLDRAKVYRYLRRTAPVEVEVTLLSCADRLATQGRKADEATAAHLELARELMDGRARLARARAAAGAGARRRARARARHRARTGAGPAARRAGAGRLRRGGGTPGAGDRAGA